MQLRLYYVYILASVKRVLYVGVTGSFENRLWSHITHADPESFTARYNVNQLVYYEEYTRVVDAIDREKQLKGWSRNKKVALIEGFNPTWKDLFGGAERLKS